MRRLLLSVTATVLLATGCATLAPVTCDPPQFDPPARLTRDVAVAAARDQLADVSGITRLEVLWGACPPNARCLPPNGDSTMVIATRSGPGDLVTVFVSIGEDGVVRAEFPQLLVPSEAAPGG